MEKQEVIKSLKRIAREIRSRTIDSIYIANSGHYGSSLSWADIAATLIFYEMDLGKNSLGQQLKTPPVEVAPQTERDILVLSKGHGVPALYSAISLLNPRYLSGYSLTTLREINSPLQGHPVRETLPMIDVSTGSLGQGVSMAAGIAYAIKHRGQNRRVYVVVGDGECQEGQVWEAFMSAPNLGLENLTVIIDSNGYQLEGSVNGKSPQGDLKKIFNEFGFYTQEVDGHNIRELADAYSNARVNSRDLQKPSMILAQTIKGKGVSFMEKEPWRWHGGSMTAEQYETAKKELS
ncbi:MAG: transketolase [Candidatus Pacearchaeota archaeon]